MDAVHLQIAIGLDSHANQVEVVDFVR